MRKIIETGKRLLRRGRGPEALPKDRLREELRRYERDLNELAKS